MSVGTGTEKKVRRGIDRVCIRDRNERTPQTYSPTFGRFLQADPIGYDGDGPNLYAYVSNDPVNRSDPLGLTPVPNGGPDIVVTGVRPIEPVGLASVIAIAAIAAANWDTNDRNEQKRDDSDKPQTTQRPPVCPPPTETTLSQVADIADDFSDATAALSLGSLALAAVTSETIVGGLTFGGLSAGLGALSALGAGVEATAQYFNGNTRGAISTGAGIAAGLVVPPAMSRALRYETGGERLVAGVAGEGYGRMASSIACGGE